MSSAEVDIEELMRERAELAKRLNFMKSGSTSETFENYSPTTDETIDSLQSRITEVDLHIADVGASRA